MKYTICYAPDDNYTDLTLISMISILENNKSKNIDFIILYSKLSKENLDLLTALKDKYPNCTIKSILIDEKDFEGFPTSQWLPVQTWFRVKIADLCPDVDKILYLDGDTLNLEPLDELFNIDISDYYLAGVNDVFSIKKHVRRLGLKHFEYVNAGIILINCKKWREENFFEKMKKYAIENSEILYCCDMDVLNKMTDGEKLIIDPKFNYIEAWWRNCYNEYRGKEAKQYKKASKTPVFVHYTAKKPKTYDCYHQYKTIWWKYAKMTPFFDELLTQLKNQKAQFEADSSFKKLVCLMTKWLLTPPHIPQKIKKRTQGRNTGMPAFV